MGDFIPSGQHSSSAVENREHESGLYARRVVEIPSNQQMRIAYGTNGMEEYVGYAPRGIATSAGGWLIHYLEYDVSDRLTSRTIGSGAWDDRATITYN